MAKEGATVVETPAGEEAAALGELQQHLQLEAHEGKYLTRQEILLLELFHAFAAVGSLLPEFAAWRAIDHI